MHQEQYSTRISLFYLHGLVLGMDLRCELLLYHSTIETHAKNLKKWAGFSLYFMLYFY